jgi:predicted RNase H-like HicB family nuclease
MRVETTRVKEVRYAVVFEKSVTGFGAYLPDLPGCVATAKTLGETRKLIREAIGMQLESMREHGERIPEPTTITDYITVVA